MDVGIVVRIVLLLEVYCIVVRSVWTLVLLLGVYGHWHCC